MRSRPFDFENRRGLTLSARLEEPDGHARAWAVFAHCFTCDMRSLAAVRVSRALAERGIGVLRFDFTGLGESDAEPGASHFSANVTDLIDAVGHMRANGCAPSLLVGHSLGGAAVLSAAREVPEARAVAVIGAPCRPEHVLRLMVGPPGADGRTTLSVAGRSFTVDQAFIDDLKVQEPAARIGALGKALLVLHAPADQVVGIENAADIFTAAQHPKSFVSLDDADHLLSRAEDADYAAEVIAGWASRYVGAAAREAAGEPGRDAAVVVEETGAGRFQAQVTAGHARFFADEPASVGGLGSGPSPYELLAAGLGACTTMTLRLYADRKGWPLQAVRVAVRHEKRPQQSPADVFERAITLTGELDAEQRDRLLEMAAKCPVHRTLEGGARVETLAAMPPAEAAEVAEEHFHDMETTCRDVEDR